MDRSKLLLSPLPSSFIKSKICNNMVMVIVFTISIILYYNFIINCDVKIHIDIVVQKKHSKCTCTHSEREASVIVDSTV